MLFERFLGVLLVLVVDEAAACGITTHIAICDRAHGTLSSFENNHYPDLSKITKILNQNIDAFRAGCTYPDTYFYPPCSNHFHQVSEDTHWTPFTNATLQHLWSLPTPWDSDTEKLVAFFFGLLSHQIADVNWHSLGIHDGFLRTMAAIDFHGVYDDAHNVGDFGGDVINVFRGNTEALSLNWYVPINHLDKIYGILYGDKNPMSKQIISQCTAEVYLALVGEQLALGEIYPISARKSPFLVDRFDNYFLGGMFDMADWTAALWNRIAQVAISKRSDCNMDENPLYIRCGKNSTISKRYKASRKKPAVRRVVGSQLSNRKLSVKEDIIVKSDNNGGLYMLPSTKIQQKMKGQVPRSKGTISESIVSPSTNLPVIKLDRVSRYTSSSPNSRLGHSMISSDLNNDGRDDLIVSAPFYSAHAGANQGAVFVILAGADGSFPPDANVESISNQTLPGPEYQSGKYGYAILLEDMDDDGVDDLIVGVPGIGSANLTYMGLVMVHPGFTNGTFGTAAIRTITAADITPIKNTTMNLGQVLSSSKLNGVKYLMIGLPQGYHQLGSRSGDVCLIRSGDLRVVQCLSYGPDFAEFGSQIVDSLTSSMIYISSPLHRNTSSPRQYNLNDTQAIGVLHAFNLTTSALQHQATVYGPAAESHFGETVARTSNWGGREVLAVSMPSIGVNGSVAFEKFHMDQVGAVALYDTSNLQKPFSVLYGDREFGRFGAKLLFSDLNKDGWDDLIVSAPRRTFDVTEKVFPGEEGAVYVFLGADDFPSSNTGYECSDELITPCPAKFASTILYGREHYALLGSALTASNPSSKVKHLFVASLLSQNTESKASGAIEVYGVTGLSV